MGIRFRCHTCEHKLNVKTEQAGRRGICPRCGGRFRIPLADQKFSMSPEPGTSTLSRSNSHDSGASSSSILVSASNSAMELESPRIVAASLYYVRPPAGGVYGPADLPTVESWIIQHRITPDTMLAPVGTNRWTAAGEIFPSSF